MVNRAPPQFLDAWASPLSAPSKGAVTFRGGTKGFEASGQFLGAKKSRMLVVVPVREAALPQNGNKEPREGNGHMQGGSRG